MLPESAGSVWRWGTVEDNCFVARQTEDRFLSFVIDLSQLTPATVEPRSKNLNRHCNTVPNLTGCQPGRARSRLNHNFRLNSPNIEIHQPNLQLSLTQTVGRLNLHVSQNLGPSLSLLLIQRHAWPNPTHPTVSGLSLLIFTLPLENRFVLGHALELCPQTAPNTRVSCRINTTARPEPFSPSLQHSSATTPTLTGLRSPPPKFPRWSTAMHAAAAEATSQKDARGVEPPGTVAPRPAHAVHLGALAEKHGFGVRGVAVEADAAGEVRVVVSRGR